MLRSADILNFIYISFETRGKNSLTACFMQERKRRRIMKAAGRLSAEDLTWLLARQVTLSNAR